MPVQSNASRFPVRELLAEFFRMDPRERVSSGKLAGLLGTSVEQVLELLRAEGLSAHADSAEWTDAATYLLDAWPRRRVIDALGDDLARERIPSGVRPVPVPWHLPPFIVLAMEHQASRAHPSQAVDDYVADTLYGEIQPETVAALAHDPAFLAAYRFPFID